MLAAATGRASSAGGGGKGMREVHDESDYWEHRDVRKLAENVGEWNEMVAAVAGKIKDAGVGALIQAPITQFANFEHLEAKGRDKRKKPRKNQ